MSNWIVDQLIDIWLSNQIGSPLIDINLVIKSVNVNWINN